MKLHTSRAVPGARWLATMAVAASVALTAIPALGALAAPRALSGMVDHSPMLADALNPVDTLFDGPPMAPGESRAACALVVNRGEAPGMVRLHGRTTGEALDAFLELTVTRGTMPSSSVARSCADFRPDPAGHMGLGPGVLYEGTLRAFPDDAQGAILDPGLPWEPGEAHAYRFVVRLAEDAPPGLTVQQSFVWQATTP